MQKLYEFVSPNDRMHYISLIEPERALVLCLVGHTANPGETLREVVTGLDHLEFMAHSREDLYGSALTFRDPDNIQLEFFWRSPWRFDG